MGRRCVKEIFPCCLARARAPFPAVWRTFEGPLAFRACRLREGSPGVDLAKDLALDPGAMGTAEPPPPARDGGPGGAWETATLLYFVLSLRGN